MELVHTVTAQDRGQLLKVNGDHVFLPFPILQPIDKGKRIYRVKDINGTYLYKIENDQQLEARNARTKLSR